MARYEIQLAERDDGTYQSDHIILVEGASRSFGPGGFAISGWNRFHKGRKVFGSEPESGPHASLFGLSGYISSKGSSADSIRHAALEGRVLRLKDADRLVINGTEYEVTLDNRRFPRLRKVV